MNENCNTKECVIVVSGDGIVVAWGKLRWTAGYEGLRIVYCDYNYDLDSDWTRDCIVMIKEGLDGFDVMHERSK